MKRRDHGREKSLRGGGKPRHDPRTDKQALHEGLSARDRVVEEILRDMFDLDPVELETLAFSGLQGIRKPLDEVAREAGLITAEDHQSLWKIYLARRIDEMREKLTGARIGSHQILGEIASGGMGIVFRARQESPMFTRDVAMKFMLAGTEADEDERERFILEVESLAALSHPFLVSILDSGIEEDLYFFSMELVEGWSLAEWPSEVPLSLERAVEVGRDVAVALDYLHQRGVVHRDVKPANIMIDRSGCTKLLDFGIAQFSADPHRRGVQAGTPHYMAPEVVAPAGGFGTIGPPTDIYALGAVLYRLLVGREVFQGGKNVGKIFEHTLRTPPEFPRRRGERLPYELERIIGRCLRKHASERYPTASEVVADLDAFLRRRRQGTLRAVIAAAAIASVSTFWLFALGGDQPKAPRSSPAPPPDLQVWEDRVEEIEAAIAEARADVAPHADLDKFREVLERVRRGDGIAAFELDRRLDKAWGRMIAASKRAAQKARERLVSQLGLTLDPEDIDALVKLSHAIETARDRDRKSFRTVDAAIVAFGEIETAARKRHEAARRAKLLEQAKAAADSARKRRRALETGPDLIVVGAAADLRDRTDELLEDAARLIDEGDAPTAVELYRRAGTMADRAIEAARDTFHRELDAVHRRLLEEETRFGRGKGRLAADVLEEKEGELGSLLESAKESVGRRRLEESRGHLERFATEFQRAIQKTMALRQKTLEVRAKVSALPHDEARKLPRALEGALQRAKAALRDAEEDFDSRAFRDAISGFSRAHTAFEDLRREVRRLTEGMVWVDPGEIRGIASKGSWIDRLEVSIGDYLEFLESRPEARRGLEPYAWKRQLAGDRRLPVTGVSLAAAEVYARYHGKELPERSLWELAARRARDGTLHAYPWGDEFDPRRANALGPADGFNGLAPVGALQNGASAAGCLHMSGNAAEWTLSSDGDTVFIAGGCYRTGEPRFLACDYAIPFPRKTGGVAGGGGARRKYRLIGFRCALRAVGGEDEK